MFLTHHAPATHHLRSVPGDASRERERERERERGREGESESESESEGESERGGAASTASFMHDLVGAPAPRPLSGNDMRSVLQVPDAPAGGGQQAGSQAAEAEERAMREAAEQRAREEAEEQVRRNSMHEMQVADGNVRLLGAVSVVSHRTSSHDFAPVLFLASSVGSSRASALVPRCTESESDHSVLPACGGLLDRAARDGSRAHPGGRGWSRVWLTCRRDLLNGGLLGSGRCKILLWREAPRLIKESFGRPRWRSPSR